MKKTLLNIALLGLVILIFAPAFAAENVTVTSITPAGEDFMAPRWSPDGAWISVTAPKYRGIWVMGPDGGGLKPLTEAPAAGYGYSWSRDSGKIAFRVKREGAALVEIVTLADGARERVTDDASVSLPCWLDGGRLAFHASGGIVLRDARGRGENTSVLDGRSVVISPAGDRVAFTDDQDRIWVAAMDGTGKTRLTEAGRYFGPLWSPDGTRLLFKKLGGSMVVYDPAKESRVELVDGSSYSWSADSERIVFERTTDDGERILTSDIFTIDRTGRNLRALTDTPDVLEMHPVLSPDGRKLLFDADGVIMLMEVGGGGE